MNANVAKALFSDALSQVLDNRVFRILCVLIAIPILFTFLIGFHAENIELLFGWRTIEYQDLAGFFDFRLPGGVDLQQAFVQSFQSLVVKNLAGQIGMMLAIAATAFFVPRMVEKGSADTLFSKPVSRLTLYFSRYVTGLLFVTLLAFVLILGMYLGLLLVSGYNDPGIFWSVLTLVYLFGLIHTVSMLFGLVTRSTVAAILLALIFYTGNGCVHIAWEAKEFGTALQAEAKERGELEEKDDEETPAVLRFLILGIDAAHYALPKTGDAPRIAAMLRRALEEVPPAYLDEHTRVALFDVPKGLVPESLPAPPEYDRADPPEPGTRYELFRATAPSGDYFELARRLGDRIKTDPSQGASAGAGRKETLFDAMNARKVELDADPGVTDLTETVGEVLGHDARFLTWRRGGRTGELVVFPELLRNRGGDWFVTLEAESTGAGLDEAGHTVPMGKVLASLGYVRYEAPNSPTDWVDSHFGWDAPLKFNGWFSIASSLAFAGVMLLIGWWRIARIDF